MNEIQLGILETDTEMLEATEDRDNDSLPSTLPLEPLALCFIISSVYLLQSSLRRSIFTVYLEWAIFHTLY